MVQAFLAYFIVVSQFQSLPFYISYWIKHLIWVGLMMVPKNEEMIIWNIRLPRVLLAFCVGASLALAGAAFQGLLRNPLADPYTIGVSSGASLGAVLVLFFQVYDCWLRKFYASGCCHYWWIYRFTHCIWACSIKQQKSSD